MLEQPENADTKRSKSIDSDTNGGIDSDLNEKNGNDRNDRMLFLITCDLCGCGCSSD
jgi:hypothetical protein